MKYTFKLIFIGLMFLALFSHCKDSITDSNLESDTDSKISDITKVDIGSADSLAKSANTLPFPSDGADKTSTNLIFHWDEVPGADKYVYQLTDNSEFSSTIHKTTVSGTSYKPDMLVPRKKYYWRVKAAGEDAEWSDTWSFTTGTSDKESSWESSGSGSSVTLISPVHDVDKVSTDLKFEWEKVSGHNKYVYQLTDNKNFISTIHKNTVSGTSYKPDMLKPRKRYFWRVKVAGSDDWSNARSFTTGAGENGNQGRPDGYDNEDREDNNNDNISAEVTLISPVSDADKVSTKLNFEWEKTSDYDKYVYQLTDNRHFTSTIHKTTVSGTSYKPDMLKPRKRYYWRVKVAGSDEWSNSRSFTTGAGKNGNQGRPNEDDLDEEDDNNDDGWETPPSPPPTTPPPSPNGFVQVHNGNFVLDGEIFRFAGTNAYYLPNYEKLNSGVVDRALDLFKNTGVRVVRMWGFYDGYDCGYSKNDASENVIQTAPGEYSESALRDLDRVIAKGKERGIRFIMPFVNYWDELGGICQYNTWAGASNPSQNMSFFMNNKKTQKWFKDYISMLLNRTNTVTGVKYKNEPAILGWQIINEGRNSGQDPTVLRDWYRKIAKYIKSIDSNHLLSTGEEGFDEGTPSEYSESEYSNTYTLRAQAGTSYILNTAIPEIDFGSAHWYPAEYGFGHNMSNNLLDAQEAWISDHRNIAEKYGKPFYLGEFGIAGWGDNRVSKMYKALYKHAKSEKLDGTLLWQLTADGTKCYEFGGNICYPDGRNDSSLYNSFKNFVKSMNASR